MKYWIDTEFIEKPCTVDLISVGLVAEDGREFYAESNEVDWSKASQWTLLNVRPQLDGKGMDAGEDSRPDQESADHRHRKGNDSEHHRPRAQAVAGGVSHLFGGGATAVLVIPADIPLILADDISALVAGRTQADVTIVPSRDGGTNALLLNADCPSLFAFGEDSAARHRGRAEAAGLSVHMRDFPLLAFDIDTIEDLRELATCDVEAPIRAAIAEPIPTTTGPSSMG